MFWGCKIDQFHPHNITSNGECILKINQICFSKETISNKEPCQIILYIKKNEIDYAICKLKKGIINFTRLNFHLFMNKDIKYQIYVKEKGEIHLIGNMNRTKKVKIKKEEQNLNNKYKNIQNQDSKLLEDDDNDLEEIERLLKRKRSLSK